MWRRSRWLASKLRALASHKKVARESSRATKKWLASPCEPLKTGTRWLASPRNLLASHFLVARESLASHLRVCCEPGRRQPRWAVGFPPVSLLTAFAAFVVSQPMPPQPAPAAITCWTWSIGEHLRNETSVSSLKKKNCHAAAAFPSSTDVRSSNKACILTKGLIKNLPTPAI